jgi:hypothetical protein
MTLTYEQQRSARIGWAVHCFGADVTIAAGARRTSWPAYANNPHRMFYGPNAEAKARRDRERHR